MINAITIHITFDFSFFIIGISRVLEQVCVLWIVISLSTWDGTSIMMWNEWKTESLLIEEKYFKPKEVQLMRSVSNNTYNYNDSQQGIEKLKRSSQSIACESDIFTK